MNLVIKDAVRQILGRAASAVWWFLVVKLMTPYLGPLRFGDYSTILKYFAIRSAFADFGLYVIGLKMLWQLKTNNEKLKIKSWENNTMIDIDSNRTIDALDTIMDSGSEIQHTASYNHEELQSTYSTIIWTRLFMILIVYSLAIIVAYCIPAYTSNPYLLRWLPVGMLFSASFMTAGILQTPLQLFRKMEQVSIGLILARVSQLLALVAIVYRWRPRIDFSTNNIHITPFIAILASVLISGVVQSLYVTRKSNKYLRFRPRFKRSFTKQFILDNRQYGIAYYLSSFHTLIVLILLSTFYPSIEGYKYTGIRALGLSLIEILLIVPSALGNSLIHSAAGQTHEEQRHKFGSLAMLMLWIGCFVTIMFSLFWTPIIAFLGGTNYLWDSMHRWSDTILPFLGIVITLSFVKQVGNYLFVSAWLHNKLLWTNLFGVIVGMIIGIPALLYRNILWWVVTQVTLEAAFLAGSIYIARKHQLLPLVDYKKIAILLSITTLFFFIDIHVVFNSRNRILYALLTSLLLTGVSYRRIKHWMRQLH